MSNSANSPLYIDVNYAHAGLKKARTFWHRYRKWKYLYTPYNMFLAFVADTV